MIEFKNVSKVYDKGSIAIQNATFTINNGDFVFLVGSSGSGKSTIIKMILKEKDPTTGKIYINGTDTTKLKRKQIPYLRRSMGVVFQDFRLIAEKTVYDNVWVELGMSCDVEIILILLCSVRSLTKPLKEVDILKALFEL